MNKLLLLFLIITITQADDCSKYENNFRESIDDIKMAIEIKSKDEAKYFVEEAYESILDLSAFCSKKYMREDINNFRKILKKHKKIVENMNIIGRNMGTVAK